MPEKLQVGVWCKDSQQQDRKALRYPRQPVLEVLSQKLIKLGNEEWNRTKSYDNTSLVQIPHLLLTCCDV